MGHRPASDTVSYEPPPRERQWLNVLAISALSAVVTLAGFRVHHWWTYPTLLGGTYGNRLSVSTNPQTIWSLPLSRPHPGHADVVTFRGPPEEVWKANTAGAAVTLESAASRVPSISPDRSASTMVHPAATAPASRRFEMEAPSATRRPTSTSSPWFRSPGPASPRSTRPTS